MSTRRTRINAKSRIINRMPERVAPAPYWRGAPSTVPSATPKDGPDTSQSSMLIRRRLTFSSQLLLRRWAQ